MTFLSHIFEKLTALGTKPIISKVGSNGIVSTSASELRKLISAGQNFLATQGVKAGDRVVLLAPNSARWVAADLAILSLGAISVPLYYRQDPSELAFMVNDSDPKLVVASTEELGNMLGENGKVSRCTFAEFFASPGDKVALHANQGEDTSTIIYTSGTSGTPKGVMLTYANIDYMLKQTLSRLALAAKAYQKSPRDLDTVFHYLPVCFAGSRIMLWTQLFRGNPITFSTDLTQLAQEIGQANPHYYLNVPTVLERVRGGVTQKLQAKGGLVLRLHQWGEKIFDRKQKGDRGGWLASLLLTLCQKVVWSQIKKKIGSNLEFMICGSAPLSRETQSWFKMIGIPVLQVYGLTETTAIVTMDLPAQVDLGWVGHTFEGCQIMRSEQGELLVKGPNLFPGYWRREKITQEAFEEGWFRTGDLVEINPKGNLRVIGRSKDLLVPESGHNIAPEPLEQNLREVCRGVEHVMVVGHGRPYLSAIISGEVDTETVERGISRTNTNLPHYRRIRNYLIYRSGFSVENNLLTANQKLRRKAIEAQLQDEIDALYQAPAPSLGDITAS